MNGTLFLLIGPTGVGKNTLITHIIENHKDIHFLPSYTSRPMREEESQGSPYYFVSRSDFEKMIENQEFVEWKFVHGNNYYGIGKQKIEDSLKSGQNLITDIEVLGALDVIECFPLNSVSIFVDIDDQDELISRIKNRGTTDKIEIEKRLKRVNFEMSYKYHFNYLIHNDDLQDCLKNIAYVLHFEKEMRPIRRLRSPHSILHHIISVIFINSNREILIFQKKNPNPSLDWHFFSSHVLKNETPKDTLTRELTLISPSISDENLEKISTLKPISEVKKFLETHFHYEINYLLNIELTDILSENENIKWVTLDEADTYLGEKDLKLLNSSL